MFWLLLFTRMLGCVVTTARTVGVSSFGSVLPCGAVFHFRGLVAQFGATNNTILITIKLKQSRETKERLTEPAPLFTSFLPRISPRPDLFRRFRSVWKVVVKHSESKIILGRLVDGSPTHFGQTQQDRSTNWSRGDRCCCTDHPPFGTLHLKRYNVPVVSQVRLKLSKNRSIGPAPSLTTFKIGNQKTQSKSSFKRCTPSSTLHFSMYYRRVLSFDSVIRRRSFLTVIKYVQTIEQQRNRSSAETRNK